MDPPHDADGFVASFAGDDGEGIRAFFDEYGFVVVRDVLSRAEADATMDELWAEMSAASAGSVVREDVSTWDDVGLVTSKQGILRGGLSVGRCAWENRQNPRLAQAFAAVLGEERLLASVDRMCFMRPTVGAGFKEEWRTLDKWLHWDENPWRDVSGAEFSATSQWSQRGSAHIAFVTENNGTYHPRFRKVQGLVALTDVAEEDGGFICVPGFHRELEAYCAETESWSDADFVQLREGDPLGERARKIPMRAGSLVIWSSRLPHANYANRSGRPRACQYVKMFPRWVGDLSGGVDERGRAIERLWPEGFEVTEHGREVFGVAPPGGGWGCTVS